VATRCWRQIVRATPGLLLVGLLLGATLPVRAQVVSPNLPPFDPTQPTPLQNLSSGLNGYSFSISPPVAPRAAAVPSNWAGRNRPPDGMPGATLDDAEPFRAGEAQRLAREFHDQQTRGPALGGPPVKVPSIYGPKMEAILRAPYDLTNATGMPRPTTTWTRPPAAVVPRESVQPAAYQAPLTPGGTASPPTGPMASQHPSAAAAGPLMARAQPLVIEHRPRTGFSDPTLVIARVDQEVILLGDVIMSVNEVLEKNAGKVPRGQLEEARRLLIQQRLQPLIESKLALVDLKRKVPKEALEKVQKRVADMWEQQEFAKKLKAAKVETRVQLEAEFRRFGTTLEREKKAWIEHEMARSWMAQHIKFDEEVTHEEMLAGYHAKIADFEYPASARWQEIKIPYSSQAARADAWRKLARAGNELLRGADFGTVAKLYSQGATAAEGGVRNWTNRGSLASEVVDQALFSLPPGTLSPILDDGKALYIIRVVERREAGVVPFIEAQVDIKKEIQQERIRQQSQEFMAKLRKQYRVWTIFDEAPKEQRLETQTPEMQIR
jgi:parvulin-like peptidyl-prolyl isomerase